MPAKPYYYQPFMKKLSPFALFLMLCMLFACTGEKRTEQMDAKACLEAGKAALASDSIRQGETLLRKAIRKAEENGDWHTCYLAYQQLAQSLSWSNSEKAFSLAKKAVAVYERHPDDERNHIILLDFAGTYAAQLAYNTEGNMDEALALTRRAYNIAVKEKQDDLICQTLTSLANIYWADGDNKQALALAKEAETFATPELLQGTLQVLARCYMDCDSLPQAEATYRRMKPGDDIHAAYIVQSSLAKIAVRRQSSEEAELAIDSAFDEAESLYFKALEQKDDYYQATLKQEQENERLTYSSALHRRTFILVIIGIVLLSVAVILMLRYRLKLLKQQRAHESIKRQQESLLHAQEKKLLQQQADSQREQLRQSAEVVAFLRQFILQRSEVIQKLNASNDSHVNLSLREWADVERTLNAIDSNLFANLRKNHPALKEEDLQLCILTRLQLSNRAIGNIYGLTVSAAQHRKLKLKKDLLGESNPDTTLEQVLERLKQVYQESTISETTN